MQRPFPWRVVDTLIDWGRFLPIGAIQGRALIGAVIDGNETLVAQLAQPDVVARFSDKIRNNLLRNSVTAVINEPTVARKNILARVYSTVSHTTDMEEALVYDVQRLCSAGE